MSLVLNLQLANPNPNSKESVRRAILTLNSLITQLSSATLVSTENIHTATADEAITAGMAVYVKNTGNVALAKADALSTATVGGLAIASAASAAECQFLPRGKLYLASWTAVTGSATLTPGDIYYLSKDTKGLLTATAPSTVTQVVTQVGVAVSTTILDIRIGNAVLL